MSYKRYQKLQKYKNGVPVIPSEFKEGEVMGSFDTLEECLDEGLVEWREVIGEYICYEESAIFGQTVIDNIKYIYFE